MIICFLADAGSVNTQSWAEHFADKLGHEVHIITLHDCQKPLESIAIHKAYFRGVKSKPFYVLEIPKIRKILQSVKPDLLIGYRLTSYGFIAACTGFRPLVLAADGGDIQVQARNSFVKRSLVKYALSKADLVHAWSENIRNALVEMGVSDELIMLMPRGIEMQMFRPASLSRRKRHSIITTRSLTDYCRVEVVLKALSMVAREIRDFEYIIVGDGPRRDHLQGLAKDMRLSGNVRFMGRINRRDIASLLAKSEVYCSMLETDGLSASLLEAMAAGAFPIVTDISANRCWIRNGYNGLLISPNSVDQLAEGIVHAFQDDDLRQRAERINPDIVENRADIEKNMRAFERQYMKLLDHTVAGTLS